MESLARGKCLLLCLCLALTLGLGSGCARLTQPARRESAPTRNISTTESHTISISHSAWNLDGELSEPPAGSEFAIDDADGLTWQLRRLPDVEYADLVNVEPAIWQRGGNDIRDDHLNFYSPRNLALLGIGLGAAAALANTDADSAIHESYQDNVRNGSTDESFEALQTAKFLGNGLITLPTFAGALVLGSVFDGSPAAVTTGKWGERSLRAVVVGAPPMLLLQVATGGSRPDETGHKSHWSAFRDNNGVSGHSFMGAVPFITAAQMTDDPWLKGLLYTASTATGLSRINDDGHFASQVMLGWWLAWLAASSVAHTELSQHLSIEPLPIAGGSGVGIQFSY